MRKVILISLAMALVIFLCIIWSFGLFSKSQSTTAGEIIIRDTVYIPVTNDKITFFILKAGYYAGLDKGKYKYDRDSAWMMDSIFFRKEYFKKSIKKYHHERNNRLLQ